MSLNDALIRTGLLLWGVPLAAATLSVVLALRQRRARGWYLAAALTASAVVVVVGTTVWFANGCSGDDPDLCSPVVGGGLLALWLVLAIGLVALVVFAALRAFRR